MAINPDLIERSRSYAQNACDLSKRIEGCITEAIMLHGNGNGILISGVYRGHFPESTKEQLRQFHRLKNGYWGASLDCWLRGGRRRSTWLREVRGMR